MSKLLLCNGNSGAPTHTFLYYKKHLYREENKEIDFLKYMCLNFFSAPFNAVNLCSKGPLAGKLWGSFDFWRAKSEYEVC